MIKNYINPQPLKNTKVQVHEQQVQNGLAITPAQMLELTQNGVPISPANAGMVYDDGYGKLGYEPPMEYKRGVDMNDMWEHREKVRKHVKSSEFQSLLQEVE